MKHSLSTGNRTSTVTDKNNKKKTENDNNGKIGAKIEVLDHGPQPKHVTDGGFYLYYEYYVGSNGLHYYYPRQVLCF